MLIYIIFIILFLLFVPLPLKLTVYFSKEEYFIKFYKLNLLSKNDGLIKKILNKKKKDNKKENRNINNKSNETDEDDSKNKETTTNKKFDKHFIKDVYKTIKKNKFKPSIKYDGKVTYSLNDSANTALFYGLLSNINPFMYYLFSIVFKVKKFKNKFNPVFKDEIIYELSISCIITFNLAQIIHIGLLILKSFFRSYSKAILKNKEVNPV